MALIKSFQVIPPGSWRYVQPETGVRFHSDFSFSDLVEQVRKHREYKGLSVENLDTEIQRQMCSGLTAEHCRPEPGEDWRPVRDLTASLTPELAVKLGSSVTKALAKFILGGLQFVPKAEAEARAAVCQGCPFNRPATMCACSSVYGAVERLIPSDRKEPGVSVCSACGCSIVAKVLLPADVVAASLPEGLVLPDYCWQRKSQTPVPR